MAAVALTAAGDSGAVYRLIDATFVIEGPTRLRYSTRGQPDRQRAELPLKAGDYRISLRAGWHLERSLDGQTTRVAATLASDNPIAFQIETGEVTDVVFIFDVQGDVVSMGDGTLDLGIAVNEDNPGGPPPGEDNPGGPPPGDACEMGSTDPCGAFVSPYDGRVIELGPRGAIMESNVGAPDFVAPTQQDTICTIFLDSFGEDPAWTARVKDNGDAADPTLFSVYRPAMMGPGETFPLISWGDGTCMYPEVYGALLRYVASQGFIVVAANSRQTGTGDEIRMGIDLALAFNDDPTSALHNRVDTTRVGVMGHSQGSLGASQASSDPRVSAVILLNGGTTLGGSLPYLAVSADMDLGTSEATFENSLRAPGAYVFFHMISTSTSSFAGHLIVLRTPERVIDIVTNFWRFTLLDDPEARTWFVGNDCTLCNRSDEFGYGQLGL